MGAKKDPSPFQDTIRFLGANLPYNQGIPIIKFALPEIFLAIKKETALLKMAVSFLNGPGSRFIYPLQKS